MQQCWVESIIQGHLENKQHPEQWEWPFQRLRARQYVEKWRFVSLDEVLRQGAPKALFGVRVNLLMTYARCSILVTLLSSTPRLSACTAPSRVFHC